MCTYIHTYIIISPSRGVHYFHDAKVGLLESVFPLQYNETRYTYMKKMHTHIVTENKVWDII